MVERYCSDCGSKFIEVDKRPDGFNQSNGKLRIAHLYKCPNERWYNYIFHDDSVWYIMDDEK